MTNPLETAAIPSAIVVLQALQTMFSNLGTDPAQVAAKFPGALQVFLGTVEMQAPALASSELSALQTQLNTKISGWITSLQTASKA
jgi:hypothetical protein